MKKNKCFLDTSALIALNDAKDQYNKTARHIAERLRHFDLFISDAVVTETYSILRYRIGFQRAHYFLKTVLAGNLIHIAEVTHLIRKDTLQILEQYSDQKISYCDALSVAMMKANHIDKIFAFDHHFEIMGVDIVR